MILDKKILTKSGVKNGKTIQIISNTALEIVVSVDGELHTIKTAGKSPEEIGKIIREL